MCIFFQFWISVRRKHLSVGIDIDAFSFGLFQKKLKVLEVMTADNDERPLLDSERHAGRNRSAICGRIGSVEKFHAAEVDFADFKHDWKKFIHPIIVADHR